MKARLQAAVSWAALCTAAFAAETPPTEYQVKAAFLYNFAKFVEWPADAFPSPEAPFTVCVIGDDPFGPDLDAVLEGKEIAGHPMTTKRPLPEGDLTSCQMLFASAREGGQPAALFVAPRAGRLTIGEAPGFTKAGGIIRFVMEAGKVRFEINPDAADKAGLKISSKLLKLARIVR
jgi:hypothetical protein